MRSLSARVPISLTAEGPNDNERRLGKLFLRRQAARVGVVGLVAAFGARIDDLPAHRTDRAEFFFLAGKSVNSNILLRFDRRETASRGTTYSRL
jgi:hypothetical protein